MAATYLTPPPFNLPFLDGQYVSDAWKAWLSQLYSRVGGETDKIDAAHTLAANAVPQSTQVVAGGGLHLGGALGGNVGLIFYRASTTVANLPTSANTGDWAYALDGRKPGEGVAAGTGVPCFWSNSTWIAATSGAAVTS